MREFKDVLKGLREEVRFSQKELAEELQLAVSTIGMYENGSRMPKYEILETIADYFNVDMNYLLGKTPIRNSYRDGELSQWENKSISILYELTFSTVNEAMLFIIQHPTVAAYGGYDLDKMSDQDKIDLANQIANSIEFFAQKFNK